MMGYKMSEQAASLRMPLYICICLQAEFAHYSIYYVKSSRIALLCNVFRFLSGLVRPRFSWQFSN